MKKLIALLLVLVLALSLVACGSKEEIVEEETTEEIVEETTGELVDEENSGDFAEDLLNEGETLELPFVSADGEIFEVDDEGDLIKQPSNEETEDMKDEDKRLSIQILQNIWATYGDDEKFAIMGGNPEAGIMDAPGVYDMAYAENLTYNLLIPADQLTSVDEAATMIHMMNANTFTSGVVRLVDGTDVAAFAAAVRDAIQGNQWICGFPETLVVADVGGNCVLIAFGVNDAMTPFLAHLAEAYPYHIAFYNEAIAG